MAEELQGEIWLAPLTDPGGLQDRPVQGALSTPALARSLKVGRLHTGARSALLNDLCRLHEAEVQLALCALAQAQNQRLAELHSHSQLAQVIDLGGSRDDEVHVALGVDEDDIADKDKTAGLRAVDDETAFAVSVLVNILEAIGRGEVLRHVRRVLSACAALSSACLVSDTHSESGLPLLPSRRCRS